MWRPKGFRILNRIGYKGWEFRENPGFIWIELKVPERPLPELNSKNFWKGWSNSRGKGRSLEWEKFLRLSWGFVWESAEERRENIPKLRCSKFGKEFWEAGEEGAKIQ